MSNPNEGTMYQRGPNGEEEFGALMDQCSHGTTPHQPFAPSPTGGGTILA